MANVEAAVVAQRLPATQSSPRSRPRAPVFPHAAPAPQATNASLEARAAGKGRHLLSFEIEPAAPAGAGAVAAAGAAPTVSGVSAPLPPAEAAPRLRARRLEDGSLEVRPWEAPKAGGSGSGSSSSSGSGSGGSEAETAGGGGGAAAAAPPQFAWPLPLVGRGGWMPYESLLRGVISSHPFNLEGALKRGAALRLTRSTLHGVRCAGALSGGGLGGRD
jgi:hypothetical protein